MSEVKFFVPGDAVGKARPRIGKVGNHARMFTPAKTANYENLVKTAAFTAMNGNSVLDEQCQCHIVIHVSIPQSWSNKKQEKAKTGAIRPISKPDLDNVVKSAMDSMNGIVWRDDSRCVFLTAEKRYSEQPGMYVAVKTLE